MYIKKIKLNNFRNYGNQEVDFHKNINVFYGDNAQGKTNIIESIYLCAMGKSFRSKKDQELIKFNQENTSIELDFQKSDRDGKIKININDKKTIFVNGIKLKKISEILGNVNIVIFSPDDINILKNGPSGRRRFLDIMISQLRPMYIHNLNLYLKTLEQRNNYLRQIKFEKSYPQMLEIWDSKLTEYAQNVYNYRKEFIEKIINKINIIHKEITNGNEEIKIKYNSDFKNKEQFLYELDNSRGVDIQKGYTGKGIHRDDFILYINDKPVNIYGSQGQNRTTILSLKMSELQIVYDEIGEYPVLLLDDFMSELDKNRIQNFIKKIKDIQVIITCTDKFEFEDLDINTYNVKNGKAKKETIQGI